MNNQRLALLFSLALAAALLAACGTIVSANILPGKDPDPVMPLPPTPTQEGNSTITFLDFEQVRDLAVTAAAQTAGVSVPQGTWTLEDTTPAGLVGASSIRYTLGPWVVELSVPVVLPSAQVFTAVVNHTSEIFRWEGRRGRVWECN